MTTGRRFSAGPLAGARRLLPWIVAGAGIVAIAVAVAAWVGGRPSLLTPPMPDLAGADPEAVEVIEGARRDVLAHPASARAWGKLGMVLRAHDFDDECVRCWEQAERLDPGEPRWPYLRGLTRVLTDPEAGLRCLERAVELCADEPLAPRLRLAEALLENGRLDAAQGHLERALRVDPDSARARFGMGRLALLRGDWKTGLDRLAACLSDEHARKLAHTLRAEAWGRLGAPDQSRAEQARAEGLPDDVMWPDVYVEEVLGLQRGLSTRHARADALTRAGQTEEAIQLLEETAERYPRSLQTRWRLGDLWRQRDRFDLAEKVIRQTVVLDPQAAEGWFRLGCVQATRQPREAVESFRRAIRLRPSHTLAHYNLAQKLLELGDRAGAAEEFRATLRCRPDYAPARTALENLDKK